MHSDHARARARRSSSVSGCSACSQSRISVSFSAARRYTTSAVVSAPRPPAELPAPPPLRCSVDGGVGSSSPRVVSSVAGAERKCADDGAVRTTEPRRGAADTQRIL